MAAVTLQQIAVMFGVETGQFKKDLKSAEGAAKNAKVTILKYLAPIAGALASKRLFGNFLEAGEIGQFARSVGESTQEIDAWQEAVRHAGGSAEGFRSTVTALSRGLAEVATTGKGRAKVALDALGISATDANGKVRKATDVLLDLASKAETMDRAQFLGLATRLGIDQGTIRNLQTGNKALREQLDILRMRAVTDEDADVAADYADAVQDLRKSFQAVANIVIRSVTPALTKVAKTITKATDFLIRNRPIVLGIFIALAAVLGTKLVLALKAVTLATKAFSAAILANPATLIILAIIAAVVALILVFEDLWNWVSGGESVLGDLLGDFDTFYQSVMDYIYGIRDAFVAAFQTVKDFVSSVIDGVKSGIASVVRGILGMITKIVSNIPSFLLPDGLADWIASIDAELSKGIDAAASTPAGVSAQTLAGASAKGSRTEITTEIGKVEIMTQATDSAGIAKDMAADLERYLSPGNAARQSALSNRSQ